MKERSFYSIASWFFIAVILFILLVTSYISWHSAPFISLSFGIKDKVFLEVIYWSLFGACTHVLMSLINKFSNHEKYLRAKDVLFQFLQLLLAPAFALLLFAVLYYNKDHDTLDKSFILVAFISGLLSGHLLLLFRSNYLSDDQLAFAGEPPAASIIEEPKENAQENFYGFLPYASIVITLELDDAGLFFDEKNEILKNGLETASVTLQKENHAEIITASKYNGKGSFIAEDLEPATYMVRAMQSVRLKDNSVLNLFGEEKIKITHDENLITLCLKRLNV